MILIVFLAQCFQKISETEAVDLAAALVLVKTLKQRSNGTDPLVKAMSSKAK
jgi:hypothetical protein